MSDAAVGFAMQTIRGRNIGILGGTFNPIHCGHLVMAENALEQLGLDLVVFAPAGDPPHKTVDGATPPEARYRMVEMAIADRPGFVISRIDLDHDEPAYTWRLLERCAQKWPGNHFHFILGGDSLKEFGSWVRPDRILQLARIAVIPRPDSPIEPATLNAVPGLPDMLDVIDAPLCAVSSTEIRTRIRNGRSIRYLVPHSVRRMIETGGYYRGS